MDAQLLLRGGIPDDDQQPQLTQQQLLASQPAQPAGPTRPVQGFLAGSGDHYVDDTGNALAGAPDANGMFAIPVNADGSLNPPTPAFMNLGPPYSDSPALSSGTPLAPPDGAVDYSTSDTGVPSNWQQFQTPHNTGTGAGFFTMDSFYGGQGQDVPRQFQSGSSMPSTNNYRLLPAAYRQPNYIMRNGRIIDKNSYLKGPPGTMGDASTPGPNWGSGNAFGLPAAWMSSQDGWLAAGWPGQLGQYGYIPPGN